MLDLIRLALLHKRVQLLLFALRHLLLLLVVPPQHLDLSVLLYVLGLDLDEFLDAVRLPLPVLLALLLDPLHETHFLSLHLVYLALERLYLLLLARGLLLHRLLLALLLLGLVQLVLQLLQLPPVRLLELALLLRVVRLAQLVRALLLELEHLLLELGDLVVVLVLHVFEQLVGEHLVRLFDRLEQGLLALQVVVKTYYLLLLL